METLTRQLETEQKLTPQQAHDLPFGFVKNPQPLKNQLRNMKTHARIAKHSPNILKVALNLAAMFRDEHKVLHALERAMSAGIILKVETQVQERAEHFTTPRTESLRFDAYSSDDLLDRSQCRKPGMR
ncbi:MAG: hypothetical protein ABJB22_04560 [Verrucomicrobiota bacterium]